MEGVIQSVTAGRNQMTVMKTVLKMSHLVSTGIVKLHTIITLSVLSGKVGEFRQKVSVRTSRGPRHNGNYNYNYKSQFQSTIL